MPPKVVFNEAGDEEIGVVIALLAAKRQRDARLCTSFLQQFRLQLRLEEIVRGALIDEEIRDPCPVFDQGASVVVSPSLPILAKVAAERLHPPRAIDGRGYGSESRYCLETARISKRHCQCAVTAHGVAHNALSRHISAKFRLD